jgi:hypothetical protein
LPGFFRVFALFLHHNCPAGTVARTEQVNFEKRRCLGETVPLVFEATQYVSLPERVSEAYLGESTERHHFSVIEELRQLDVYLGIHRGVDIEGATRFLRCYGIARIESNEGRCVDLDATEEVSAPLMGGRTGAAEEAACCAAARRLA